MLRRHKVYAYITRAEQLLVFKQVDFPEAGIQIPGGTIESGELPEDAVLREAVEETGLERLHLVSYLGSDE
jgi:ADP-ribose pyrophosphatase YjhB (NUDIX family)